MKKVGYSYVLMVTSLLFTLNTWAASPQSMAVNEISYPQKTQLNGVKLELNGSGIRQHPTGALYSAALYLEKKGTSADAVISDLGAKRLSVTMLREVNSREIGDLLSAGLTTNSSDVALADLMSDIMALGSLIAETRNLQAGDGFQIEWSRKNGTIVKVQRTGQVAPVTKVFTKSSLMPAMMRIWLGERPVDPKLKSALLGF